MIIQTRYKDYDMKNQQENEGRLTMKINSKELFKIMDNVRKTIPYCSTDTNERNTS